MKKGQNPPTYWARKYNYLESNIVIIKIMTAITFGEICLQGFYSFEVKTIQKGCDKGNKIETQFLTV